MQSVFEPKSLSCAHAVDFELLFTLLKISWGLGWIAPNPSKSNLLRQSKKLNNWIVWFAFSSLSCHCERSRNIPAINFWLPPSLLVFKTITQNTSHFCHCTNLNACGLTVWWKCTMVIQYWNNETSRIGHNSKPFCLDGNLTLASALSLTVLPHILPYRPDNMSCAQIAQ